MPIVIKKPPKLLSSEEKARRRVWARIHFKALIRMVIDNKDWLDDVSGDSLGIDVKHNVAILRSKKRETKSILTLDEKALLSKPTKERTNAERAQISKMFAGLKCFKVFPKEVREKLAASTYFFYCKKGRPIIKQDQMPQALYFILYGEVNVTQAFIDPLFKKPTVRDLGLMSAGEMFGEVSLLHNIPRVATIAAITDCELLILKKEDFELVLKDTVHAMWDEVQYSLDKIRYFDSLNAFQKRECVILSKIQVFAPRTTILGDGNGLIAYTYFILEGQCQMIEHMKIRKQSIGNQLFYNLVPEEKMPESHSTIDHRYFHPTASKVLRHKKHSHFNIPQVGEEIFLQVCIRNAGDCFNVGENLNSRRIIALTTVKCLAVPYYWLHSHNQTNVWTQLKQSLDRIIPSKQEVFELFICNLKWNDHRFSLFKKLKRKNISSGTTVHDIPITLRMNEVGWERYGDDLNV